MDYRFFCYNCLMSVLYLNCCKDSILYFIVSYIICSLVFINLKNKLTLEIIRTVLCFLAIFYFMAKLIRTMSVLFDEKNLIIPVLCVLIFAIMRKTENILLINRYAFVCGIIALVVMCVLFVPQIKLKVPVFDEIQNFPLTLSIISLPFSFDAETSLKSTPIMLALNYLFIFSSGKIFGLAELSESTNINFIFSSLKLVFVIGLFITALPVISTCVSYFFDQIAKLYKRILPFVKKHKLIIN